MELFKLFGTIVVNNKEANEAINETTDAAGKAGRSMSDASGNADKLSGGFSVLKGAASQLVANGLMKVANAFGQLISSSFQYSTQMEQYNASFAVMTGNAEKAAEVTERLQKLGAETPFEMTDLADATQLLMNYGLSADDAIDKMTMLGDISQGSADKMNRIAMAYGQMSSAGKVYLVDVKQMIEAGFNPLQEISETTGESMASLYDRISKGTISVDEITASMQRATAEGGKYYQSMDKQSKTFEGRLSTLKDTANAAFGEAITPIMRVLADEVLPAVTAALEKVNFEQLGQSIAAMLPTLTVFIAELLPILVDLINQVLPPLISIASSVLPVVVDLAQLLLPPLITIIQMVLPALLELLQPLLELLSPLLELLQPILDLAIGILSPVTELIENLIAPLTADLSKLIQLALIPLQVAFSTLSGILSGTVRFAFNLVMTIVNTAVGVFDGLIKFLTGFFTMNWRQVWTSLGETFDSIWQGIKSVFTNAINWIIDGLNSFIRAVNNIQIPDWVPVVGGKGINIPLIPRLEEGGILEKGQVGFLEGNGAEAVVPLDQNKKWISAVAADMNIATSGNNKEIQELKELFREFVEALPDMMVDAFSSMKFDVNNREFARLVKAVN